MDPDLDKPHLSAWRMLRHSHAKLVEEIDRDLTAEGRLPIDRYDLLAILDAAPNGKMRMHELAQSAFLSRSGMTRLADRLESIGLIAREVCGSDRRGAYALITKEGKTALDASRPAFAKALSDRFAKFVSKKDAVDLSKTLKRIVNEKSAK